jgi:hypothetical protein
VDLEQKLYHLALHLFSLKFLAVAVVVGLAQPLTVVAVVVVVVMQKELSVSLVDKPCLMLLVLLVLVDLEQLVTEPLVEHPP